MMNEIYQLIEQLKSSETKRLECARNISSMEGIKKRCNSVDKLTLRVGAVDASVISQEFHTFDLIMIKTVGVIFNYVDGSLESYEYIPSPCPEIKLFTHGSMELAELGQFKTIVRLKEEITLAKEVAEKCDVLFIDGSIAPLPGDKPSNKELKKEYDLLVKKYLELFSAHEKKIVGIVKDSRSRRFMEEYKQYVDETVATSTNDTALLDDILKKGERTTSIKCSGDPKTNPVLKDLMPYSERMYVSYIKAGSIDRPLRIEFFQENEHVLDAVYSLCAINNKYTYPSVLIEADLRALIDQKESERILREIALTPFLKNTRVLRRDSRPFRY